MASPSKFDPNHLGKNTWVPNIEPGSDFSIYNLPFGIVSTKSDPAPHVAAAIGSHILDLKVFFTHPEGPYHRPFPSFHEFDGFEALLLDVFSQPTLNAFAALGRAVRSKVRNTLQQLLVAQTPYPSVLRDNMPLRAAALLEDSEVTAMHLPMTIGDYTDFYAGYYHAHAVGTLFRGPDAALQPNYLHMPIGYHGRSSSIVVSDTPIRRPVGQVAHVGEDGKQIVSTGPTRKLDIELELGCFIASENRMGDSVDVDSAAKYVFGYVLLNDWSARDVQAWEYVPLGPFNGKNFATTISPWVVLAEAMEPYRTVPGHELDRKSLQPYLCEANTENVLDINLRVYLQTTAGVTTPITRTNSRYLIWSFPQMIAHHTLGGCPLRTGDLLGSGTISGPDGSYESGSLLEVTENGKKPLKLVQTGTRTFLEDGDTVIIRGFAGADWSRVGFGPCRGKIIGPSLKK
ncbi:hypothetical protein B0J18DRAFT_372069 [Chaetomium sp. MPI-SDFR-AT-0129]|uniref:Fumarylacetoacetase n=1 Tax=Dichotomopilus funicola TaxID=1934379 RepID=A0AAN6ZP23_9PEZI|nr:hypothetical protein B0J18DRAFT_372069 [Chaetomium sp. MPI-SDFR-AT-0129]KAK4145597.1 hypothetical protein C8A04DRAFT_35640 [Dichotomopilus funicola]